MDRDRQRYETIIATLRKQAEDALLVDADQERHDRLQAEANGLQRWLEDGALGEPPLNSISPELDVGSVARLAVEQELIVAPPDDAAVAAAPGVQPNGWEEPTEEMMPLVMPPPEALEEQEEEDWPTPQSETALLDEPPVALAKEEQLAGLAGEEETPELRDLRTNLKLARSYFDQENWLAAAQLAALIADRAGPSSALAVEADQLRQRARIELDRHVDEIFNRARLAQAAGDRDLARREYQRVLELDPENEQARRERAGLSAAESEEVIQADLRRLAVALKQRRDLEALGRSVYEAEALAAEDRLGDELLEHLRQARQDFNRLRTEHGDVTTLMYFGDLEARQEAVEEIRNRLVDDEPQIFNATTNQYQPTSQVLEAAILMYQESSRETAQYEVDRIRRMLPAHPVWARDRLKNAKNQPFEKKDLTILDAMLDEIEGLIVAQQQAEGLVERAEAQRNTDPLTALRFMREARDIFPHLPGLEERVAVARQAALESIAVEMGRYHQAAATNLQAESYADAFEALNKASALFGQWPEGEQPVRLAELLQKGRALEAKINQYQALREEFNRKREAIRERVGDPNLRQAGMSDLQALNRDERFAANDLPPGLRSDVDLLNTEMDQYKDIGEQLAEARIARAEGRWDRLQELAKKIQSEGKAGQSATQVEAWLDEAALELAVERLYQHLQLEDISAAGREIGKIFSTFPARADELRQRLQAEQDLISRAAEQSPPMKALYDRAEDLRRSSVVPDRFQALRLFQYVSGDTMVTREDEWPPYDLSLYTTGARRQWTELRNELREELLEPLVTLYQTYRSDGDGSLPDEAEMGRLAERARQLREARLLNRDEAEQGAVRWLELRQGRLDAETAARRGDWNRAVVLLETLDSHYPRMLDSELRDARIQQALMASEVALNGGDSAQALDVLRQAENVLGQTWELPLQFVRVYSARGEFDAAATSLKRAAAYPQAAEQVNARRQEMDREREVQKVLAEAEWELQSAGPRDALRVLQDALDSPRPVVADSARLKARREEIFRTEEARLLQRAREKKDAGPDDKIEAVVALVDLGELEKLANLAEERRRSTKELPLLQAELVPVATTLIREAHEFDWEQLSLSQALDEASKLTGRLQTFCDITPLFAVELDGLRNPLESSRSEVASTYARLQRLDSKLQEALQPEHWDQALINNSFDHLEQYGQQLINFDLDLLETRAFQTRLDEWRLIYAYLHGAIADIRTRFSVSEEFAAVVRQIRLLQTRPERDAMQNAGTLGLGRAVAWQQVQQKDYEHILRIMSARLQVQDLYSPDGTAITGFDAVREAAEVRLAELQSWQEWDQQCKERIDKAGSIHTLATRQSPELPIVEQRKVWSGVQTAAQEALDSLERPPTTHDGQTLPAHSARAEEIQKRGANRAGHAHGMLRDAERFLETNTVAFPEPAEFIGAATQRNAALLRTLIERAERIGPSNEDERTRLAKSRSVLQDLESPQEPGLVDRLRGLLGRT